MSGKINPDQMPEPLSLFRLVVDQARLTPEVRHHEYQGSGTEKDPRVVVWIPNDPGNPFNWRKSLRWTIAMTVAVETLATSFASSAFSGTLRELVVGLNASTELITAGISLFVLGFALGPLLWAPLSEIYGRQIIFIGTFAAFTAFNAGAAGANNITSLLIMRFFAGSFGSSPFTNGGGVIADIFTASERGMAMSFFALAPSMGPTMGPFISGFLGQNEGWRWVMGMLAIFTGVLWIVGAAFIPETYAPVLLRKRALALSKASGKVYKTQMDIEKGPISIRSTILTALLRPWILLFLEPIVLLLSIYIAIVYGTLYMLFGAFPIVFQVNRGWSEGIGGLPFLGVAAGMIIAVLFLSLTNKWYLKSAAAHGGVAPPEARLPGTMIGAISIPIGMFWFAWTNAPSIHWISPVLAGVPFGFGLNLIFLGVTNYLIDGYTIFAASVLAANTVLRSLFGAAFPLFTKSMYDSLGIHWASSVPAFLALACVPFPFLFYKYGAAIRARCVYASQAEAAMNELRARAAAAANSDALSRTESAGTSSEVDDEKSEQQPRFEAIKTTRSRAQTNSDPARLVRTQSKTGSIAEAVEYNASPYDIDRVNTTASVAGLELSRTWTNRSAGR